MIPELSLNSFASIFLYNLVSLCKLLFLDAVSDPAEQLILSLEALFILF